MTYLFHDRNCTVFKLNGFYNENQNGYIKLTLDTEKTERPVPVVTDRSAVVSTCQLTKLKSVTMSLHCHSVRHHKELYCLLKIV